MMTWIFKKLGEVIQLQYGKGISKCDRNSFGRFSIYGANGELGRTNKFFVEGEGIIIGRKGSAGEIIRVSGKFWPSDVTYYVFGNEKINIDYLYYFLKKTNLKKLAVCVKPGINRNRVYEIEIPLPSLKEQEKIVKKIEELFEKIDEAQKLRDEAQKDSVNLIPSALDKILSNSSKRPKQNIDSLAVEIKSGFSCGKSNEVANGVVHLRTHNIDLCGELNMTKIVRIPEVFVDRSVFYLNKGDILFNNTNSAELVGKTVIIRESLDYAFSNHITRLRLNPEKILPEWLLLIFQKYWREKIFTNMCTRWVGQAGINQTALGKIQIPLPSLSEQKKIVEYLDSLSEKVRELKKYQAETAADFYALRASILHAAFEGKL